MKKFVALICIVAFALNVLGDCAGDFVLCLHDGAAHIELGKNHFHGICHTKTDCSDKFNFAEHNHSFSQCTDIALTADNSYIFKTCNNTKCQAVGISQLLKIVDVPKISKQPDLKSRSILYSFDRFSNKHIPPKILSDFSYFSVIFLI